MNDGFDVTTYRLPSGTKPLDEQILGARVNDGITDPEVIAERVEIQVDQTNLPASALESLIAEFSSATFQPALSMSNVAAVMGGVQYDLWLDASDLSTVHYSFKDGFEGKEHTALARWMNRVHRKLFEHPFPSSKNDP